jgi:hypothetical protein
MAIRTGNPLLDMLLDRGGQYPDPLGVGKIGTPGINPNAPDPRLTRSQLEKPQGTVSKIDGFLKSPGGGMLMNILAQSGYSTTPQSPFGAIGKAALMTQQQGQERTTRGLTDDLIRARTGLARRSSGDPDAPSSVREFEFFQNLSENEKRRYLAVKRAQQIENVPGAGLGSVDPLTNELDPIVDESTIVSGIGQRELVGGEASRGRLQQNDGSFEPVPGTEADIKATEADRKRAGGAFMKSIQSQTVVEDVDRFNKMIKDVPFGREAQLQSNLPVIAQSDAYRNATALIESVKGNVGIDSLLRIKATGAGLGQVPQSQLDLLSRLLGELNLNQTKDQFTHTWDRMGQVYQEILDQSEDELLELGELSPNIYKGGGQPEVIEYDENGNRL